MKTLEPNDAIKRDEALAELGEKNLESKSTSSRSNMMALRVEKHGLTVFPDPNKEGGFLYSRKECRAVWARIKPLPIKSAA